MLDIITNNLDIWTSSYINKSSTGRGSNGKQEAYGIKKLRELILELAVRGKLVPQDPNDEPASVLLEKIAKEKEDLIKEGKVKKQKPLPKITQNEITFGLPKGWEWVRIGDLFNSIISGGTPSKSNPKYWNGNVPWASVKDLGSDRYIYETQDYITELGLDNGSKLADKNDILICTRMGLGKIAVLKKPMAFNQDLKSVKLSSKIEVEFFLNTYATLKIKGTGTTVEGIKQEQLLAYIIGLPPIEEQKRIVAKVNELMALCDQLEQQHTGSIDAHKTLVETLLGTLTRVESAEELIEAWKRIAEHFDTLFTTEDSIDQLKQTILQLAVMGKLVPQDPNDEHSTILLNKIKSELNNKTNNKKSKLERDRSIIEPTDFHFEIPKNWTWCELQDISIFMNGKAHEQYVTTEPNYILVNSRFVSNSGEIIKFSTEQLSPLSKGDIAIVMSDVPNGRALARCYIIDQDDKYTLNQRIGGIITTDNIDKKYLTFVLDRNNYYLQYDDGQKQTNLKKIQILSCPIPLPPLSEQQRIVCKVDELMDICNELESKIKQANEIKQKLADAVVQSVAA